MATPNVACNLYGSECSQQGNREDGRLEKSENMLYVTKEESSGPCASN